jgi:indole-3-glycerol phosphate synthase
MILDEIVADKRIEIAKRKTRVSLAEFRRRAESLDNVKDFAGGLRGDKVRLIAEIKNASPSRGVIRAAANPTLIAETYGANGASAISVVTDRKYFRGDVNYLKSARVGSRLPLLRKDFIVDEYQLYESRALQADAVLLIVRILEGSQLRDYLAVAESLRLSALVEIHDARELEHALYSGASVVGINNRNLSDFAVDLNTTERLAPLAPPGVTLVSESGIFSAQDVARMGRAGADAVLVGEALMRAQDTGAKVRELAQVARRGANFKLEAQ